MTSVFRMQATGVTYFWIKRQIGGKGSSKEKRQVWEVEPTVLFGALIVHNTSSRWTSV